jgi:hypothetical protein
MPTTYTNSLSYLNFRKNIEANRLGYINSVLYGLDLMGMIPIVPANDWMQDIYFERKQATSRRSGIRLLNEEPDPGTFDPFEKKVELTSIYRTQVTSLDKRLAQKDPSQMDMLMRVDAQDMMQDINFDLINGTLDQTGRGIMGLRYRIPSTAEVTASNGAQVDSGFNFDAGSDLNINGSTTNFKKFLRLFRAAKDELKVPPGGQVYAFTNTKINQAITSGRDELGANVTGIGTVDILNSRVNTIDDTPLLVLRDDSAGSQILPFTEANNTGSLYLVVVGGGAGEGSTLPNGVVILSSDQVIREYADVQLTQIQGMQEMDIGLRVPRRSVARVSRLQTTA